MLDLLIAQSTMFRHNQPFKGVIKTGNFIPLSLGFFQVVCLPMYSMLARALPNTAGLRDGCVRNIASWQEEAVRADEHRAEAARHHRHHHHHHHHDEPDPSDETDPTAQGGSADGRKSPNVDEHHHHGHGHCHHHGHCHGGHHDGGESSGGQQQPLHSSVMGEHDHAYGRHSMQMGAAAAAHHHHAHHNAHGHSSWKCFGGNKFIKKINLILVEENILF